MKIRRCAVLYIEPREVLEIDWAALFSGASALAGKSSWIALAPHLGHEVVLDIDEVKALGAISQTVWQEQSDAARSFGLVRIERLLAQGLLVSDDEADSAHRGRDDTLRSQHWRPVSALAHAFSRWEGVTVGSGDNVPSFQDLVDQNGAPPAPTIERCAPELAIKLPAPDGGSLDELMFRRYTGRNFDVQAELPMATVARLLQRTFGAQELHKMAEDGYIFKKLSPSGGSMHPIEAYVMVQRVEGLAPGLYHYHPVNHSLEPVQLMEAAQAAVLARQMVADQQWFADAPMLVVMAARVKRNFWKYRNHMKASKALALDGGHLSQNFYLLATEAGLAAFITAAVNDVDIERALGLDHLCDAVIAVCGCGKPSGSRDTIELRFGEPDLA
jgi:putative peptide maturation dehydrogenase